MKYTYFPGCCAKAGSIALGMSVAVVSEALGLELKELEDWNCCGATAYSAISEMSGFALASRNLALAEPEGLEMITPCSGCYRVLRKTNISLQKYPQVRKMVDEALAAGGLKYGGGVKVKHVAQALVEGDRIEAVRAVVKEPLKGLRVAVYYGCQLTRPAPSYDDPELPQSLDHLVEALGAEPVNFPLKARCCGGSSVASHPELALEMISKILFNAVENGAQCIIVACPLCHSNLDSYQGQVSKRYRANLRIPVLFVTQLMGVALGAGPKELGLGKNIVSAGKVLAPFGMGA